VNYNPDDAASPAQPARNGQPPPVTPSLKILRDWSPQEALGLLVDHPDTKRQSFWTDIRTLTLLGYVRPDAEAWGAAMALVRGAGHFTRDITSLVDFWVTEHPGDYPHGTAPPGTPAHLSPAGSTWDKALSAVAFVAQPDEQHQSLVSELIYPGAITILAAPRGVGKSMTALPLAIAAATGGIFRDQMLHPCKVLLVDRDNPPSIVRQRLRGWGVEGAEQLKVLTRKDAPSLTDRNAWEAFPVEQYDVVIVDSLGSATEGISEKEGKETQHVLATLKDLAQKGPSLLLLENTNKAGENYRGRGEKADAVDVLYECRDITGWVPENADEWWLSLPEAGDHTWAARASRRRGKTRIRLAFIPSKFRLGIEPQPFALELNLVQPPYTLEDITEQLTTQAVEAARVRKAALQDHFERASNALLTELARYPTEHPMLKYAAIDFLRTQGLTARIAKNLLEQAYAGTKWTLKSIPGLKGNPIGVYPVGGGSRVENNAPWKIPVETQAQTDPDFLHPPDNTCRKSDNAKSGVNTTNLEVPYFLHQLESACRKSTHLIPSNGAVDSDTALFSTPIPAPAAPAPVPVPTMPHIPKWRCETCGETVPIESIYQGVCTACWAKETREEPHQSTPATTDAPPAPAPSTLFPLLPSVQPAEADPKPWPPISVEAWESATLAQQAVWMARQDASKSTFNPQKTDSIEWARWSWNPVTGCLHNCEYCYARESAEWAYTQLPKDERFAPHFWPERLVAPGKTRLPVLADIADPIERMGQQNVFVCSMADLFGKWVPPAWIDAVLAQIQQHPEWTFLFLTKFPQRLAEFAYPPNTWIGTTVDCQAAVDRAEKAFRKVRASGYQGIAWLSCEPMLEDLTFTSLDMFDWVVMGGRSKTKEIPEFRPPVAWIAHLWDQAKAHALPIYMKTNLLVPGALQTLGLSARLRAYPQRAQKERG
jgi:protein gp37